MTGQLQDELDNLQSDLKKAEEIAAVARTSMADVIKQREMARKVGATELEGYPQAEKNFFRLTKEIENNNLDYALKNKEKVKNSYRELEITAIKRNVLGEVRITLDEADRLDAKKYAEGRGLSIWVQNNEDVEVVKKLLVIKVNN